MEKEHLEVLLEDIQGKFELVLEGHESLRKEIREARDESNQKHKHTAFLIETIIKRIDGAEVRLDKKIDAVEETLGKKIDGVASDLAAHRADTESHTKAYRVSDGKELDRK